MSMDDLFGTMPRGAYYRWDEQAMLDAEADVVTEVVAEAMVDAVVDAVVHAMSDAEGDTTGAAACVGCGEASAPSVPPMDPDGDGPLWLYDDAPQHTATPASADDAMGWADALGWADDLDDPLDGVAEVRPAMPQVRTSGPQSHEALVRREARELTAALGWDARGEEVLCDLLWSCGNRARRAQSLRDLVQELGLSPDQLRVAAEVREQLRAMGSGEWVTWDAAGRMALLLADHDEDEVGALLDALAELWRHDRAQTAAWRHYAFEGGVHREQLPELWLWRYAQVVLDAGDGDPMLVVHLLEVAELEPHAQEWCARPDDVHTGLLASVLAPLLR